MIVAHVVSVRCEARSKSDHLPFEVDGFDLAHPDLGLLQHSAQRTHDVGQTDRPGNHFWKDGVEDEVVFLADQNDFEVVARAQPVLQFDSRIDPGEPTPENKNPGLRPCRFFGGLEVDAISLATVCVNSAVGRRVRLASAGNCRSI